MTSRLTFTNALGIKIVIYIPFTDNPEWARQVAAWKEVIIDCWKFKEEES